MGNRKNYVNNFGGNNIFRLLKIKKFLRLEVRVIQINILIQSNSILKQQINIVWVPQIKNNTITFIFLIWIQALSSKMIYYLGPSIVAGDFKMKTLLYPSKFHTTTLKIYGQTLKIMLSPLTFQPLKQYLIFVVVYYIHV